MPRNDHIRNEVLRLRRRYGTCDPLALCKAMDIRVCQKPLGPSIKAFFFYQSRIRTVVLNSTLSDTLGRVLCAHELGHAVLHAQALRARRSMAELQLFDRTATEEYEANRFAAELLIDDRDVMERCEEGETVYSLAARLFVPHELLLFKLAAMAERGESVPVLPTARADFWQTLAD